MNIRPALPKDLPQILPIYKQARAFMASYGNIAQWGGGYPQRQLLERDIENGRLYLLEEEKDPAAVFMFFIGTEPTYEIIENGSWPDNRPYGTIHRLASANRIPHSADLIIDWCSQRCFLAGANLRGDTHEKNIPMQKVFQRNGFIRCGTIHVSDGTPRIAYQKTLYSYKKERRQDDTGQKNSGRIINGSGKL